jgi:hypothetical protein
MEPEPDGGRYVLMEQVRGILQTDSSGPIDIGWIGPGEYSPFYSSDIPFSIVEGLV